MSAPENDQRAGASPTPPRQVHDADTMRALAHPSRLALWELLTVHGPLTATQAAEHVDESPSNCSFHLRQLARFGLVEEANDVVSTGRSRPWRVTHVGYTTGDTVARNDIAVELAAETLSEVVLERAVDRHHDWQRRQRAAEPAWRVIGGLSQTVWWATAEEAAALRKAINALTDQFRDRLADPSTRPPGSRPVEFVALVHPFDDSSSTEPAASAGEPARDGSIGRDEGLDGGDT